MLPLVFVRILKHFFILLSSPVFFPLSFLSFFPSNVSLAHQPLEKAGVCRGEALALRKLRLPLALSSDAE